MLAEKRSKQRWSSDPRNTSWSEDRSKYGYRMLEKMGWSEGQGLGRDQDGRTEHVKMSRKSTNTGVGYSRGRDDDWIEHQTSFDEILASLNATAAKKKNNKRGRSEDVKFTNGDAEGEKEEQRKEPGSLMNTAISSGRAVYKKVLRSKDLSSASREDLDCVFGRKRDSRGSNQKKKKRRKVEKEEKEGVESVGGVGGDKSKEDEEADKNEGDGEREDVVTTSHGVTTILQTTTVQEYFAAKLAQSDCKDKLCHSKRKHKRQSLTSTS